MRQSRNKYEFCIVGPCWYSYMARAMAGLDLSGRKVQLYSLLLIVLRSGECLQAAAKRLTHLGIRSDHASIVRKGWATGVVRDTRSA